MAVLTDSEIHQALGKLHGWQRSGIAIQRVFQFPDFKAAMVFVNKIAEANKNIDALEKSKEMAQALRTTTRAATF